MVGAAESSAETSGSAEGVFARFDDLTGHSASFVVSHPVEQFVARAPGQVAAALRAAEEAARRNLWVAGFVSYEAAPGLDASLPATSWPAGHPLADLPLVWFAAFERREEVRPCPPAAPLAPPGWQPDRDRAWHRRAVGDVQRLITDGDLYQLNLTLRLSGAVGDPAALYGQLAAAQAGAYNALVVTPDHTIVSASPELFFTWSGERIVTRPMKGTTTRGRWPGEDLERARVLQASPKERAENVMIVDLLRNDLGRLATFGSVEVPALFDAERYPTVWQLTSTVAARAAGGVDLAGVFAALFPSGSVTGAPKRRTMQAIAEIEGRPRGVYCGAVGYLAPHPSRPPARFSVAIRTVTVARGSSYAEYGTGGGITSGSDADAEWAELLDKAAVLRRPARPPGLIETLRFEPPELLVNLERHLDRLRSSAAHFDLPYNREAVLASLAAALRHRERTGRVRISLRPSGEVGVEVEDLVTGPAVVRLGLAEHPVSSTDVLLFHKQSDRTRYDAFRRPFPRLDDVVLWNEQELVTEATTANLAVRLGGRWWTPALGGGLLPGVERGRLLDEKVLEERDITLDELRGAEALAVVSSLRGWRPAILGLPTSA